jgi:hypothetical protein
MTGAVLWWLPLGTACVHACLLWSACAPNPPFYVCIVLIPGFTEPSAIYRVDMAADQPAPELFRQTKLKVPHNPSDYETHQVSLADTGQCFPPFSKRHGCTPQMRCHCLAVLTLAGRVIVGMHEYMHSPC